VLQEKKLKFRSISGQEILLNSNTPIENNALLSSLEKDTLQNYLLKIFRQSRSAIEEQGYTILFLALGILEYTQNEKSDKTLFAPLLLIPVDLMRGEDRLVFSLKWTGEDLSANFSLQESLKEQGFRLPDFETPDDKSGIDEYFNEIQKELANHPSWKLRKEIYLDFFSFKKFIMYRDLDPAIWTDSSGKITHPLLTAVFDQQPDPSTSSSFNPEEADKKLPIKSVYHIMDADSSQIAVIEDIKAKKNLVVEGPLGTGKSQTIANTIAELLAQGNTVLFISEKMAALDVVKKRLDNAGIGDFCLALHSEKANKKVMLDNLLATLNQEHPGIFPTENEFDRVEELRSALNSYPNNLHEPIGDRHLTPYQLFGLNERIQEHFKRNGHTFLLIDFQSVEDWTERDWAAILSLLTSIGHVLPRVHPIGHNPWNCTRPGLILPPDEERIRGEIQRCLSTYTQLQDKITKLIEVTGITRPINPQELNSAIYALQLFNSPEPIDRNILVNPEWNVKNPEAQALVVALKKYQDLQMQSLSIFSETLLSQDLQSLYSEYEPLSQRFFLINFIESHLNSRYRNIRNYLISNHKKRVQEFTDEFLLRNLRVALQCQNAYWDIQARAPVGKKLFGSFWQGEWSDPKKLEEFSEWIVLFRQQILMKILDEKAVEIVSRGPDPGTIHSVAERIKELHGVFHEQMRELADHLSFNSSKAGWIDPNNPKFSDYGSLLNNWNTTTQSLASWSQYCALLGDTNLEYVQSLIRQIEEGKIPVEDIVPTFEVNYFRVLLRLAFQKRPVLAGFIGTDHEDRIKGFRSRDKWVLDANKQRIRRLLWDRMPKISGVMPRNSPLDVLNREFNKKRKIKSIRKLMTEVGGTIQQIKPCFMMSPISVAQFLDPKTVKFDVIIFDEASQVMPEDALGALLRGRQAVVIGDSKQLPPTSFFDKVVDADSDDDSDDDLLTSETESILNLCARAFPIKRLGWHYRSRHESLIALSNQQFYQNGLYVYPSPVTDTDTLGLKFVHLPECHYDREIGSINKGEAEVVARAAIDHYLKNPELSLGIGTFNIRQRDAIDNEIQHLLKNYPVLQPYFNDSYPEYCFVKNLETIQGDERDVIFLSIGFGKDRFGKLNQNFGPINKEGGERRLNVLMTRARRQCVVFSNFTARDLSVDDTSAKGLQILKLFLEYAETGNLPSTTTSGGDFDSPFEEAVFNFLDLQGYNIEKQVGCAGYRIDLAIRGNNSKGNYVLGIECDGSQYHSSRVARDRDRLRQEILENLGWKIYRIWSTDWYRDGPATRQKLLDAVRHYTDQN